MNFLIDRCAGRRVAERLRSLGHDVAEATSVNPDPGDRELLPWAVREDRVLVTIDTDFGEFIFLQGQTSRGVIWLPDVRADQRVAVLEEVLRAHANDLAAGASITVKPGRIRVSWPPA